jgi:2-polyprenyl-3-methyl-5-hydroxy-6-metoxy-1,4-benzoquinol methylase
MTYNETAVTDTIDRLLGEHADLDVAIAGSIDNLDQYHVGGAAAVERLIPGLNVASGNTVLDVGCGLGGPARQIARRTGAHVVGIDITAEYIDAARHLSANAGLAEVVRFEVADVATYTPEQPFDAAVTMHVQMNIEDKVGWFGRIADKLKSGGRLAVWEICREGDTPLAWPMPWSIDGTDSFLQTTAALRTSIEAAGLITTGWTDETAWVRTWMTKTLGGAAPRGPALSMLLDNGLTRVINLAGAINTQAVSVWRGSFTKPSG